MDLTFFNTFFGWWNRIIQLLSNTSVFGVSLWGIIVGFLCTSMVITVFWKGAKG